MRKICYLVVFMLFGCATPYQRDGLNGGYSETQLAPNIWEVTFDGNAYTDKDAARQMGLLRSAELTLQQGYRYFIVTEARSLTEARGRVLSPSRSGGESSTYDLNNLPQTTPGSNKMTTRGQTTYRVTPTIYTTIVMYQMKPIDAPLALNAQFVCASIGKKFDVTCKTQAPADSNPPKSTPKIPPALVPDEPAKAFNL